MAIIKYLLMLPVWILSVFTMAKYFGGNPVIGSLLLNRCGLHVCRVVISRGVYRFKQALMCRLARKEDRVFFREHGYLLKENFLPPETFAALEHEILSYDDNFRQTNEGDTLTERASIPVTAAARLPALSGLLSGKPYFNLVRYTSARNERPLVYIERITQHHHEGEQDSQKNLHKDTFHPTVKAWLYINDVTHDNGPFVYVPGSHRLTRKRLRWEYRQSILRSQKKSVYGGSRGGAFRITEEERVMMGVAAPRAFTVPKNTLIIADTFGLHCRGNATTSQSRTAIWSSSRVNPFNPFPGCNSKILTQVRDRMMASYYRRKDREKKRV